VSSTRYDPGPHLPINSLRNAVLLDAKDVPIPQLDFLKKYPSAQEGVKESVGLFIAEEELHKGLHRNDLDGTPSDEEGVELDNFGLAPESSIRSSLRSLGYHVPRNRLGGVVQIFQSRWKRRVRGRRGMQQVLQATGLVGDKTKRKISEMRTWWDNL
jgi:hypothetical protein